MQSTPHRWIVMLPAEASEQIRLVFNRSNHRKNMLTATAPITPATTIPNMITWGIHHLEAEVIEVPHSGHTTVRLAWFLSTSQCHKSKTKNLGFAGSNLPRKPQLGQVFSDWFLVFTVFIWFLLPVQGRMIEVPALWRARSIHWQIKQYPDRENWIHLAGYCLIS